MGNTFDLIVAYPENDNFIVLNTPPIELSRFLWNFSGNNAIKAVENSYSGTILSCAVDSIDKSRIIIHCEFTSPATGKYELKIIIPQRGNNEGYLNYFTQINDKLSDKLTTPNKSSGIYYIHFTPTNREYNEVIFTLKYNGVVDYENNPNSRLFAGFNVGWYFDPAEKKASTTSKTKLSLTSDHQLNTTPSLQIVWRTDRLGSNLGEIICIVEGNYLQKDRYPIKLLGKYSWFRIYEGNSYFSCYPNMMTVIKGIPASTYFQKACELNNTKLNIGEFYTNLLSFMSIRYYLGGLTSEKLDMKWMLQRNTKELYDNIRRSEFSAYLTLLTSTYKEYDQYMRV